MAENYEMTMTRGDTGEPVRACIVQDSDGKAPDWTGATVTFKLYEIDEDTGEMNTLFESAASVELPTDSSGTLRYAWNAGDTDRDPGRYPAKFKVVQAGAPTEHYPRDGYMWITIEGG